MLAPQKAERGSESGRPWADLLRRHREQWVASLGGERSLMWLDDYTHAGEGRPDVDALRAAAAEGRAVIVGLPADAGGAAEREAGRLAAELGGVTVCQRLAAGSLIVPEDGDGADAVHFLVCVNVDEVSATAPASLTGTDAVPLMSGYVRFLEEANRSLSEANVRLARERLGVQDSAAAKLAADLQTQLHEAHVNYEAMLRAAVSAPRYRAADKLRDLLFQVPGLSALLRLRSRLIRRRSHHA
jgi:hypothetical protein